jgi:homoserine kinase
MKIIVRVPATAANLGPGFDCLGLALQWWNTIVVEDSTRPLDVQLRGESEGLAADASNLTIGAMRAVFRQARLVFPHLRVTMWNRIPLGRGLGSSAAAIVGGVVAANTLAQNKFTREHLLALATELEGHPDNVAPALLGGLVIVVTDGKKIVTAQVRPPRRWRAVLFVPEQALSTKFARKILPRRIPRADAIFNIGRAALLVHAFASGTGESLDLATRDRLHQPYRARLVPGMNELLDAARDAGAHGAALSGAGPSLIAFAEQDADRVAHAFMRRAQQLKIRGTAHVVKLSAQGAQVRRG